MTYMDTPEEQKAHRAELVRRLRSGDYTQGHKRLRIPVGDPRDPAGDSDHCCLGVACDQFHEETGEGFWITPEEDRTGYFRFDDGNGETSAAALTDRVRNYFGFRSESGDYGPRGVASALTSDNDGGMTFDKIAQIIEDEPEGLIEE